MFTTRTIQDAALHDGRVFAGGSAASLAAAAALIYRLLPGTKGGRLKLMVGVQGDALGHAVLNIGVTFGGTTSASGSALTLSNQSQVSSATSTATLHQAPTVSGAGTAFAIGMSGQPLELILAPSVLYLITLTNTSTAAIDLVARFELTE